MAASPYSAALPYRVKQAKWSRQRSRHVLWRTPNLALRDLGVSAIKDTRNGLLSTQDAGLQVVITRSTYGGADEIDGAMAVMDHLGDPTKLC